MYERYSCITDAPASCNTVKVELPCSAAKKDKSRFCITVMACLNSKVYDDNIFGIFPIVTYYVKLIISEARAASFAREILGHFWGNSKR